MQLRWILTAAAVTLALAGCSDGEGTATADPTPTPTTVATTTQAPTPSPTPTTTAPASPFPGIAMTFTGGNASDGRVAVLKTFVAGSAYSQREYVVGPELRGVLSRDLARFFAGGVNDAKKKGWVVSEAPIAHVASLKGGQTSTARLCRWSPSVSWLKNGKLVEARENQWNALAITMRSTNGRWVITRVDQDGQCSMKAPR